MTVTLKQHRRWSRLASAEAGRVAVTGDQVGGGGRVREARGGRGVGRQGGRDRVGQRQDVGHGDGNERRQSRQLAAEEQAAVLSALLVERGLKDVRRGAQRHLGSALAELRQKSGLEPG